MQNVPDLGPVGKYPDEKDLFLWYFRLGPGSIERPEDQ